MTTKGFTWEGNQYRVHGIARHSETLEWVVVYQALYGNFGVWIRPVGMFMETVSMDGRAVPRFCLEEALPALTPSDVEQR